MKIYLHSNYGVYEEKHSNKETDVREGLLEKRQQKCKLVILPEKYYCILV